MSAAGNPEFASRKRIEFFARDKNDGRGPGRWRKSRLGPQITPLTGA